MPGLQPLNFERDGARWPQREYSRFVTAAGSQWHVQIMGTGPVLLLVHGTGSATHSWRDLMPLLAQRFTVIAPDLPGHGFSRRAASTSTPRWSLPAMAADLSTLLEQLQLQPRWVVGHSAGAAILARMCIDRCIEPVWLMGLNAALLPLRGVPAFLFSPLAKLFAGNRWLPTLFARRARDPAAVARLIASTGSTLDARGLSLYGQLISNAAHAAAALDMMACWDLRPLLRDLPHLPCQLKLVVGSNDRTLSPQEAQRVQALLPATQVTYLTGLGHLAHEEAPQQVAALITAEAQACATPA